MKGWAWTSLLQQNICSIYPMQMQHFVTVSRQHWAVHVSIFVCGQRCLIRWRLIFWNIHPLFDPPAAYYFRKKNGTPLPLIIHFVRAWHKASPWKSVMNIFFSISARSDSCISFEVDAASVTVQPFLACALLNHVLNDSRHSHRKTGSTVEREWVRKLLPEIIADDETCRPCVTWQGDLPSWWKC